jgi:hypothetical protein
MANKLEKLIGCNFGTCRSSPPFCSQALPGNSELQALPAETLLDRQILEAVSLTEPSTFIQATDLHLPIIGTG